VTLPPVLVTVAGKTDLGRTRDHNEDTFLVADLSTGDASLSPARDAHPVGARGSLFMVADGMGGAAAGEVASALASEAIYDHLRTTWSQDHAATPQQFAFRVREAVEEANRRIHTYAAEHPDVRGMGTTVTVAGVFGQDLYLAQIGDSRAYLVRRGQATQLTKDQSLTQRLVDAGELTEEEAEKSERRNIILQALGPEPQVRVDLTYEELRRGDLLILCSDGLSGQVKREEFAEHAVRLTDLDELCSALIDLANGRGGPDNITVVAARFEGDGLQEPEATAQEPGYHVFALPGDTPMEEITSTGFRTGEIRSVRRGAPDPVPDPVRPRPPVGKITVIIIFAAVLLYFLLRR
jgi:PPM family protein phosphatase